MNQSIDLPAILEKHREWLAHNPDGAPADLTGAHLEGAHLQGAHLTGVDLTGAHLQGANLARAHLVCAHLQGADLTGADLTGAHLQGANLQGANLARAHLQGADLEGADLTGAHLQGAYLPTGETLETYLSEVVPHLLIAGARGVEALAAWNNHDWSDCPIAVAFNIHSETAAPALLRPRIRQFIQLYDARLIPRPEPTIFEQEKTNVV